MAETNLRSIHTLVHLIQSGLVLNVALNTMVLS